MWCGEEQQESANSQFCPGSILKLEPIGFAVQKMWAQKPKSQGDASLGLRWGLVRRAALGGRSGAVWGSKESEVVLSI